MPAELADALSSLAQLIDDENDRLMSPVPQPDLAVIVEAKVRLSGLVQAHTARLSREQPEWLSGLDGETRASVAAAIEVLLRRLDVNARLLERRIALCDDLMGAISDEARRLSGARTATYGARGAIVRNQRATPISLNNTL